MASCSHAGLGFRAYKQECYLREAKSSNRVKQAAKGPSSYTSEWTPEPTWQHLSGLVRRHKNRYADLKKE